MGSKHDCNTNNDDNLIQECCANADDNENNSNSAFSGHEAKEEDDEEDDNESVGSMPTNSSPNGEDCTAHNSTGNSVTEMEDSLDTAWTDDKHSSYLNSIEASFVEQMYEKKYRALDMCGRTPKQNDSSDPDCVESRPNFPSPITKFKVLQKGYWQKLHYNRAWHLGVSTPPAVLASPWIQHFIPAPYFRGHEVPSQTVHETCDEHGIAAVGGPQINAHSLESEHSCHMRTVHKAFCDANKQVCVQHHRIGYKFVDSKSICGKTEMRNICNQESFVHPDPCFDKGEQDIMRESDMERNHINRLIKKQKMKIESICCSDRDQFQVVPLLQRPYSADLGDCISKLNHKKSTFPNQNSNNIPVSLDNKWLTENDGCSTRKNWKKNTSLHTGQENTICPVITKSSSCMLMNLDLKGRRQSQEENS